MGIALVSPLELSFFLPRKVSKALSHLSHQDVTGASGCLEVHRCGQSVSPTWPAASHGGEGTGGRLGSFGAWGGSPPPQLAPGSMAGPRCRIVQDEGSRGYASSAGKAV